jgi:hypothetical protein
LVQRYLPPGLDLSKSKQWSCFSNHQQMRDKKRNKKLHLFLSTHPSGVLAAVVPSPTTLLHTWLHPSPTQTNSPATNTRPTATWAGPAHPREGWPEQGGKFEGGKMDLGGEKEWVGFGEGEACTI